MVMVGFTMKIESYTFNFHGEICKNIIVINQSRKYKVELIDLINYWLSTTYQVFVKFDFRNRNQKVVLLNVVPLFRGHQHFQLNLQ
jgi:hypothetical protein